MIGRIWWGKNKFHKCNASNEERDSFSSSWSHLSLNREDRQGEKEGRKCIRSGMKLTRQWRKAQQLYHRWKAMWKLQTHQECSLGFLILQLYGFNFSMQLEKKRKIYCWDIKKVMYSERIVPAAAWLQDERLNYQLWLDNWMAIL